MNQDEVKLRLQQIKPGIADFTVIFTGKASHKVNGRYKPGNSEILLHNKNFNSDIELMYTAIHEFAHHVHFTSECPPAKVFHNKMFWAIFHTLLEQAISLGIYQPPVGNKINDALGRVRESLAGEGAAFKRTGGHLLSLIAICREFHVRFEDYVDRELRMKRKTAELAMAAFAQDVDVSGNPDQVKLLVKIKDPEVRRDAQLSLTEGKSLAQLELNLEGTPLPSPRTAEPDPIKRAEAERKKLVARLARLEEEAEAIRTKINALDEPAF